MFGLVLEADASDLRLDCHVTLEEGLHICPQLRHERIVRALVQQGHFLCVLHIILRFNKLFIEAYYFESLHDSTWGFGVLGVLGFWG